MPYNNVVRLRPGETPFTKYDTPDSPIMFPVVERPVYWQTKLEDFIPSREHKALVRIKPSSVDREPLLLSIVGSSYQLVHNRELMASIEDAMLDSIDPKMLDDVRVTDRVSAFGRTCYREYIFPNIRCRLPAARNDIAFRLIAQNGYGGSALRIHAGAIDFYCTNGMISGEYSSAYRRHTSGLVIENLNTTIKSALDTFAIEQVRWQRWVGTPVKHAAAMALLTDIARSPTMFNNLTEQYMRESEARGRNLWSLYSTMTYYASHNDGAFKLRKPVDDQNTEAQIMLQRELSVAKWIQGDAWKALEGV